MDSPSANWSTRILIVFFLLAIFAPPVAMMFEEQKRVSQSEQRRLARWPAFEMKELLHGGYQGDVSRYLSDHFGLREWMLSGARAFKKLFQKSISRHVIVGNNGWFYFNIDGSLHDYIGQFTPSEAQLASMEDALEIKSRWLGQLGVRYLLVPIPGKMSVYPDHLPARIRAVEGTTRLQAFSHYLKNKAASDLVLNPTTTLADRREINQVYFKTDTHWTDDGAYAVYVSTMEKLTEWFGDIETVSEAHLGRSPRFKRGDTAVAGGYYENPGEAAENVFPATPCADDQYQELPEFKSTEAYKARPKGLPVKSGCASRELTALVVHDSFGAYLKKFLNESFREVIYMPSYDVYGLKSFIETVKPDVYIDFRADRRFHLLLQSDPRMVEELN